MAFRVAVLALFVSAMGVSGYFRSRAAARGDQIERLAEGMVALIARMVAALPLAVATLLFVFRPSAMAWAALELPAIVRWIAVAVGVLMVAGTAWTLHHLGANVSPTVLTKESQDLVRTGPYAYVRHPLYAVGVGMLLSIGVAAANAFILGWSIAALVPLRWIVIPREERELVERFGDAYLQHRSRTGALLPRLVPRR